MAASLHVHGSGGGSEGGGVGGRATFVRNTPLGEGIGSNGGGVSFKDRYRRFEQKWDWNIFQLTYPSGLHACIPAGTLGLLARGLSPSVWGMWCKAENTQEREGLIDADVLRSSQAGHCSDKPTIYAGSFSSRGAFERRPRRRHLSYKGRLNTTFLSRSCICLLYTSPSPRDATLSRMPSSA